MKTVKRYQNRKLYDTEKSRYITLTEIESYVKLGYIFQVIDHNKKDITKQVLGQLVAHTSDNFTLGDLVEFIRG